MKFSKKGDRGFTSLMGGQRISKSGPRPEAYGTLDEASSALGIARASATRPKTKEIILSIQKDLLHLGAELATSPEDMPKYAYQITKDHVERLERLIAELQEDTVIGKEFVLPGATMASAAIDLGRAIVRRAERKAVRLLQEKIITNAEVLRFLNRLADLLFTLARYEEGQGKPCIP
ncbi:MAG: cob(I)yrinic acid a,c-diamide adenosyltransferase [Deltaproteobacteria bacterium]|nr:cob(I)yrinic acid a,c-diamide adenosyltransferase [Deltaproteobacteria bacterium]